MVLEMIRAFRADLTPIPRGFVPFMRPDGRLEIEVGCGTGIHPLAQAIANPSVTYVAIEHTEEKFKKFSRRIENHGNPTNLRAIHGNAISWITHSIMGEWVDRYWLLYPNPLPKTRDRNQRWHAMPFFRQIVSTLKRGTGELALATNLQWYADEAQECITRQWGLELVSRTQPEKPRTAFEKKYMDRGEVCWDLRFVRPL